MTSQIYSGKYADANGTESIIVENDFKELRTIIRGVEFRSGNFLCWTPSLNSNTNLASFSLDSSGDLLAFKFECHMPIPVIDHEATSMAELHVEMELSPPSSKHGFTEWERLNLTLEYKSTSYRSSGKTESFEDEFLDLKRLLPVGLSIKSCFTCAFSDYDPYAGSGPFGGLACFRDNKAAYRGANDKRSVGTIWSTRTEFVQETYLCSEWEKREPNAGYRG